MTASSELSEIITQLAFYADWPNAFSALPVAKEVFEKCPASRGLPPADMAVRSFTA